MSNPNEPTNSDTPWEEAMSRDFDARVRDLHEAPVDLTSVKGKARKIRRNRRAAVAGGILGVAAIVTPIAVLSNGGNTQTKEPDFAPESTETTTAPMNSDIVTDYIVDGVWHQADGDEFELPDNANGYDTAVLWNDRLVATRWDGEVFSIADVIDADGTVVDSFPATAAVVVNEAGTTIAWVDTDGDVMTAWDGGEVSLGNVDLAAAGESIAARATGVTGGPDCHEAVDGCVIFLNTSDGPTTMSSHGIDDNPVPNAIDYADVSTSNGSQVTYIESRDELDGASCGGLWDLDAGRSRWSGCDYEAQAISPNGLYVVGAPTVYDGLGFTEISILDASTGEPTGRYVPEGLGAFIWSFVGWSDANTLLLSVHDSAGWHLISLAPDGNYTELAGPVAGDEFDSPFTVIQH